MMRIDVGFDECKKIIASLRKSGDNFTADRFDKMLKLEKGKKKKLPLSNSKAQDAVLSNIQKRKIRYSK